MLTAVLSRCGDAAGAREPEIEALHTSCQSVPEWTPEPVWAALVGPPRSSHVGQPIENGVLTVPEADERHRLVCFNDGVEVAPKISTKAHLARGRCTLGCCTFGRFAFGSFAFLSLLIDHTQR